MINCKKIYAKKQKFNIFVVSLFIREQDKKFVETKIKAIKKINVNLSDFPIFVILQFYEQDFYPYQLSCDLKQIGHILFVPLTAS